MTQIPKISLDEKWRYHYATASDNFSNPNINDSDWEWTTFTGLDMPKVAPPEAIWLRKRFHLNKSEACLRYFLRCDDSSLPMTVYLRGQKIAELGNDANLDVDVTDYVSLDDNVLALAIHAEKWDLDPQQAEIYLQPIFCDDLD